MFTQGSMEKTRKESKDRFTVRIKRRMTSVLRGKKLRTTQTARNRESENVDPQLSNCEVCVVGSSYDDSVTDEPEPPKETNPPAENPQNGEGLMSASDEKLIKDMPSEAYKKLVMLLQPLSATGRDYKSLADRMGYSNQYIQFLQSTKDPVLTLIKEYQQGDKRISELISLLRDMKRYDVVEELQPYIAATLTPREREVRQQAIDNSERIRTVHESYDAFVCFGKNTMKDKEFVEKLVRKMESSPYNLRLCLGERDFLGGGCSLENAAVAIEKRCTKFVVILSSSLDNSEGALFELHIAMSLSPGAKEQPVIPVLIEDAYRFQIPRTIAHLTYLDYPRSDETNFWERLARSLGWKPQ